MIQFANSPKKKTNSITVLKLFPDAASTKSSLLKISAADHVEQIFFGASTDVGTAILAVFPFRL